MADYYRWPQTLQTLLEPIAEDHTSFIQNDSNVCLHRISCTLRLLST